MNRARQHRRGDRTEPLFAAVHESAIGPQPKWAPVVGTSAIEGEPETGFRCCERRL